MTEPAAMPVTEPATGRAAGVIAECRLLAAMTEEPSRTTRRYLTPPVAAVHAHLRGRMESLGMAVRVDAVGNLRGLWQPGLLHPDGAKPKRLILGSHIDTVPNAGAFDGVLGVVLAIALVVEARRMQIQLPIEVIAFSEEEGMRYEVPYIGSRAVAGSFDLGLLATCDADGIRMDEAIRAFGLDPGGIAEAALGDDVLGFFELHIEQGPVLESEGLPLAVVEGIAGQSRLEVRFLGQANHAGTTPMHLRRDALAGAAEWMNWVESASREVEGLVATVGRIAVAPSAPNVVPGLATLSLDVRHMRDTVRSQCLGDFLASASAIASRRGLEVDWVEKMSEPSVHLDPALSAELSAAVEVAGFPAKTMPSGAGHDAMVMAARFPTAMLFLRSPGGISHHPDEAVLEQDVEAALRVGEIFLNRLSHGPSIENE